jgi:hypothetical protein
VGLSWKTFKDGASPGFWKILEDISIQQKKVCGGLKSFSLVWEDQHKLTHMFFVFFWGSNSTQLKIIRLLGLKLGHPPE